MKIIIGLGNPGEKYKNTRHNIGFMFLNFFAGKNNFSEFKIEPKFIAEISIGELNGEKIILLKPQTYMNLSGESVQKIIDFYKINKSDLIVIYDDISMDFSKIRFRETGTAGGHNGIKDIIKYFGEDFKRVKIGVGFNDNYDVSDWVLSRFKNEEIDKLEDEVFLDAEKITKDNIF